MPMPATRHTARLLLLAPLLVLTGCSGTLDALTGAVEQETRTLAEAREGRDAGITQEHRVDDPVLTPPEGVLELVEYPGDLGDMVGYLTPDPGDGELHPAIVWISGGDQALWDFWTPLPPDNDQTAAVLRDKGLVTFYPGLRGLNGNPGSVEGFYGEVDDVVAATQWLKEQPWVDPERVYLGGHSTGGTLALLSSEYADAWAGVFAFGPIDDIGYYDGSIPINIEADDTEGARLRSPIFWLNSIAAPTYVIEGDVRGEANVEVLEALEATNTNPDVHIVHGGGCNHFTVLHAGNAVIADAILADDVASLDDGQAFADLCG